MTHSLRYLGLILACTAGLLGCRTETRDDASGQHVVAATPLGGVEIKVRTDENAAETGVGLPVYPGATLEKKAAGKDGDNGTADINLSLGSMRLRVKVLSYQTNDSPEDVRAFYGKALKRFGTVISCASDRPMGEPTRTPEGLTCDKDDKGAVHTDSSDSLELKAGSPQHQHAVSIEKKDGGTKFALVLVDLPARFTLGDDTDKRPTQ